MLPDWQSNCVLLAGLLKRRQAELFDRLVQTLTDHGVQVRLLDDVRDIWVRDYCPVQVALGKLVKFRYDPDYLRQFPALKTGEGVIKAVHDLGSCRRSSIVLDGGNIVAAQTRAIVTDKIYKENPKRSRVDLKNSLQRQLQLDQLVVIPKEPFDPIGHADAMVRFIDEDHVLVNDYRQVHPAFGERLSKILRRHHLAIETMPYCPENRSKAGIPSAVGCYINFLRTAKVLVAPVFGTKQDAVALKKLATVFPGLPIVPLKCTALAREGGVLNCIAATYRTPDRS